MIVYGLHDWQFVGGGRSSGTRRYRCSRCRQDRLCSHKTMLLPTGPCSGARSIAPDSDDALIDKPSVA